MPATPPASSTDSGVDDPVLDQAIAWLVRLRADPGHPGGDTGLQGQIEQWCGANPAHAQVWRELMAAEEQFQQLVALPVPAGQWQAPLNQLTRSRQRRQARRRWLGGVALGLGGLAMASLAARQAGWFDLLEGSGYTTATGAQRRLRLSDGTALALNTDSQVQVRFDLAQRLLVLRQGEIFVDSGKDTQSAQYRPLRVRTAHAMLQALGTRFDVRQQAQATRLTVIEGQVAVETVTGLREVIVPGEMVEIDAQGQLQRQAILSASMDPTAWLEQTLVARQMRLGDLVAEMARYRHGWLQCDPAVADLRISGVFQLQDNDAALDSLAQALPVVVQRRTRFWVRLAAAGRD
ncbi:FecR domain-containing protein [Herbaspirillum sp. AP02]|uniref:FecR family protein n=1 Tax=unclassified Herbaspirillum TaxID=2624150 RepID=UPI0018CB1718|nr:FecR domain-containing protein [Herbaspirillum sp. AP02]MBG7618031.1 FecR domain-containing protein [Herbaspirillum sp. AP02]